MSAAWDPENLLAPISADHPCGESLEDTDLLTSFDSYHLFGEDVALDTPLDKGAKREPKPAAAPIWTEIRDKSVEALARSRDLRVLAYLGTSLIRTDGVAEFCGTLEVAAGWLETYWAQVYPLVDEDAILRRNALNNLADKMAVVEALRRAPLVRSRQHGLVTLRDVDGAPKPAGEDGAVAAGGADDGRIRAAFAETPIAELSRLVERVAGAPKVLQRIQAKMSESAGTDAAPAVEPLASVIGRIAQALRVQLAAHPDAAAAGVGAAEGAAPGAAGAIGGPIASRQDAIRALDAVAEFFKRTEPSSPIPLFLTRARRLVAKDFLEVLADIAPEALPQARTAGGLKNE